MPLSIRGFKFIRCVWSTAVIILTEVQISLPKAGSFRLALDSSCLAQVFQVHSLPSQPFLQGPLVSLLR